MNTLISAVYDEKSLRKKVRLVKYLQSDDAKSSTDTATLQDGFGGFPGSSGHPSADSLQKPALTE